MKICVFAGFFLLQGVPLLLMFLLLMLCLNNRRGKMTIQNRALLKSKKEEDGRHPRPAAGQGRN
jgi:hypothetical protein